MRSERWDLCREVAAIQRQQPLPMPFGGVTIVDRPLRKREAVMGAGINLDLGVGALYLTFARDDRERAALRAAMPLRSEPDDAAVADVLGTLSVRVAVMAT